MKSYLNQLVIYVHSEEPFDWGLELHQIAIPLRIYCPAAFYQTLSERSRSEFVELIPLSDDSIPSSFEKIDLLCQTAEENIFSVEKFFWVDVKFLQAYVCHEFLYGEILDTWFSLLHQTLISFKFPILAENIFFGGDAVSLFALKAHCKVLNDLFLTPDANAAEIVTEIRNSFYTYLFGQPDINLELASVIKAPVLHIIGDETIFYGLTPTNAIGVRSHVLVKNNSDTDTDFSGNYTYRFSHNSGYQSFQDFTQNITTKTLFDYQIKPGDFVLFGLGTDKTDLSDIREVNGETEFQYSENFVKAYLEQVASLAEELQFIPLVIGLLPPLEISDSDEIRTFHDFQQQVVYCKLINSMLQKWSDEFNIHFFDFYAKLALKNGMLDPEKSDGYLYLNEQTKFQLLSNINNSITKKCIVHGY